MYLLNVLLLTPKLFLLMIQGIDLYKSIRYFATLIAKVNCADFTIVEQTLLTLGIGKNMPIHC